MKRSNHSVTRLLVEMREGADHLYDELFSIVYDNLKTIANRQLNKEYNNITLSKTSLVHEVYLKLMDHNDVDWQDRAHFYAIVSKCMRQILIDHARKKSAKKRGGGKKAITYLDGLMKLEQSADQLINLDSALNRLKKLNPRLVRVVECRYFGEISISDTAAALGISEKTVNRDWKKAKGWLHKELKNRFEINSDKKKNLSLQQS